MNADDIQKILRQHGIEEDWLHEKPQLNNSEQALRVLSRMTRITGALRDIVEAAAAKDKT